MNPYGPIALLWMLAVLLGSGHLILGVIGGTANKGGAPLVPRDDSIAWFGWCAAAGTVLNCMVMFAWLWAFPGTMSAVALGVVQLFVIGSLWYARRRVGNAGDALSISRPASSFENAAKFERGVFWAALALALALGLSRILDSNQTAALTEDSALLWGFKARVMQATDGLGDGYLAAMADPRLRHENYPLFNPILQMWMFQLKGATLFVAQRLPIQLLSLALILTLAGALRKRVRPAIAAVILTVFCTTPFTAHVTRFAVADGMVALGMLLAVDAWLRWREEGRAGYFGLMAIGLSLMIGSKNEATLFLACFGGALLLLYALGRIGRIDSERSPFALTPRKTTPVLLFPLAVFLAGSAFNSFAGFENDMWAGKADGVGFATRFMEQWQDYIVPVWTFFFESALTAPRFDGLLFLCLSVATLLSLRALLSGSPTTRDLLVPIAVTASFWAGLFLIYLATPQPLTWHLETSALRVLGQTLPLAALALAGLFDAAQHPRGRIDP